MFLFFFYLFVYLFLIDLKTALSITTLLQDVKDVLSAVDYAIDMGFADPSRITVLGGSHGGFLTTHLIGQAPDKFVAAVARNLVCNLASMVGISDIHDWCFFEAYGDMNHFTEAPSPNDLSRFHQMSPISHVSRVKPSYLFIIISDMILLSFGS